MFNFSKKDKEDPKDLKSAVEAFADLKQKVVELSSELEQLKQKNKVSVQKIGIVRYNPFGGVGGDQSFSLALLDENNDGVMLTSLFTREDNRVYGKALINGSSKYSLSKEEVKAIEKAKAENNNQENERKKETK